MFRKLDPAVEGCLSAKAEQYAIRFLCANDLLNVFSGYGKKVYLRSWFRVRLNRCYVRIYEDGLDSLFAESLETLGPAIIKFGGLANFDGAASKYQCLTNPFMSRRG